LAIEADCIHQPIYNIYSLIEAKMAFVLSVLYQLLHSTCSSMSHSVDTLCNSMADLGFRF